MHEYDVIVIGGGSAGTSAAKAATQAGARTLLVNDGELGGLCILRGCMPTKAMLASAHVLHEATHAEPLGLDDRGGLVADFSRIMLRKDGLVRRFQRAKIRSVEQQPYDVLFGRARFKSADHLDIDGRRVRGGAYVIATGSTPVMLDLPGIGDVPVLTSDDVMRLTRRPAALVVQGAGPIGLELAQFFARVGTRVTLVNRSPLLSRHDAECGEELARALGAEPRLELIVPGVVERLQPHGSGLRATIRCGDGRLDREADALLLAAGRRAAVHDLGLEHLGLDLADGRLECDEHMRTRHSRVFVAGDATGAFQVLHLANQEGTVAGHNASGARPERRMSYRLKMSVIFTDPPFASVGMSEDEARRARIDHVVGRALFPETGRAITMGVEHGLWKLISAREDGAILGSALIGPRADDLIHVISTMMHYGACVPEIGQLPWYHPTLAEVLLNLARDTAARSAGAIACDAESTLPPGYSGTPPVEP